MIRTFARCSAVIVVAAAVLISPPQAFADNDLGAANSVVVSFGAGLNTAQPGNAANHHVLPRTIHVKVGGVVNFAVSGFHQIFVYNPGKKPSDVVPNVDPAALFINDETNLYYKGIVPAGGPAGTPATGNPSNAVNRMEGVSFSKPGLYLVICNVAPHFRDGMWAWIRVTGEGQGHD